MYRSNVARPKIDMLFSIRWCQILKQFDFVSAGYFQDSERNLGTGDAGDFSGKFTRLVYAMREFEAKNVLPKVERTFEIRDRDASMVCGEDSEWSFIHSGRNDAGRLGSITPT